MSPVNRNIFRQHIHERIKRFFYIRTFVVKKGAFQFFNFFPPGFEQITNNKEIDLLHICKHKNFLAADSIFISKKLLQHFLCIGITV